MTSGLYVKVRPEKSQLWKIKSLYQLNPISTAPHKLDFIWGKKGKRNTCTDRREKEQRIVFLFCLLRFLPQQKPHQVNLYRFCLTILGVNMIVSDVQCPEARRGKMIICGPFATCSHSSNHTRLQRRQVGPQCDSYLNPNTQAQNAKEH